MDAIRATIALSNELLLATLRTETMWFAVFCLFMAIIAKLITDWEPPKNFPPGPKGIPFIGNLLDLRSLVKETKFYSQAWMSLAKQYGPVVGLRLGMAEPLIIVSGRDAILEMLSREEFDGRPDGFIFRHRTLGQRRGIIFTDGSVWKDQRRFALRNLKDFGFGTRTMEDMILHEAVILTDVIKDRAKKGPIKKINRIATVAILNSLWSLIAGSRYEQDKEDPGLTEIVQIINDIFKDTNVSGGLMNHLPFLRHVIPGLSGFKAKNERLMKMWKYFSVEVWNHKQTKIRGERRDLIDVYLEEIEARKFDTGSSFNEMQLIALIKDFFTAGVETTNNSIGFVIMYLMMKPEVQEKIHTELDSVLDKDTLPSIDMRNRLPFLNATIAEVTRLANVGPTSIPHRATADSKFLGYEIKKDYMLLANLVSVHMDKAHWGDPEEFRPERFLDENGQFFNDPWMIPFGAGKRRCLGENLAKDSLFLLTACLLQKFNFLLPPGEPKPSLRGVDGFTISPPNFNAVVTAR